jgi:hypothetical protein
METQKSLSFETGSSVHRNSSRPVLEQLVNETIDSVFSSLGTACRQAIYDYMEDKYGLKKGDIADHAPEFSGALEQIFGDAAALLEMLIMKEIHQRVPQFKHRPDGTLTFPDYVNALSRFIRKNHRGVAASTRTIDKNGTSAEVFCATVEQFL